MLSGLKMKYKVVVLFSFALVATVASMSLIYTSLQTVRQTAEWSTHSNKVLRAVNGAMAAMVDRETGLRGFLITANPANLDPYKQGGSAFEAHLADAVRLTSDNPEQQKRLAHLGELATSWASTVAEPAIRLMGEVSTQDQARSFEVRALGKTMMDELRATVSAATAEEEQLMVTREAASTAAMQTIEWAIFGGTLAVVVVLLGAGAVLIASTVGPLNRAVDMARRIGAGDLTYRTQAKGRDEIGDLLRSMNAMSVQLSQIVSDVIGSAAQVAAGSRQSAATAEQLSSGSSEQAAASEQTSAAVEEMSGNVRQNADNAAQAERTAVRARALAEDVASATTQAVASMAEVAEKVRLVQEIARQTDLLALNAAIEAARAGPHGK
ncbi:methyl-accepting chemotaxis protein, partial [Aureimonas jatrophae]